MKWFTRAWQRGEEPAVDPSGAYASYVRGIATQLPVHVRDFALPARRHLAIDDAKVDRVEFDRAARTLRLRLLNGDLPTGYGKLTLDFAEAEIVEPGPLEASSLLTDRSTELLNHEVELVAPGRYEVRFLLYPRGELHVRCNDVRATWEPLVDQTRTDYRAEVIGLVAPPCWWEKVSPKGKAMLDAEVRRIEEAGGGPIGPATRRRRSRPNESGDIPRR